MARHLSYAAAVDGRHCHCLAIAQQVKTAGKIVSPLAIGDNAFIAWILPCTTCDLHKTLQKNMQGLTRRTSALYALFILRKELLTAFILLHGRLLDQPLNIGIRDPLKESHTFQDRL